MMLVRRRGLDCAGVSVVHATVRNTLRAERSCELTARTRNLPRRAAMKSDNSVKVSMKVSDDRVEDIKQTTSRSSISPTDHGSGHGGMGRNSIEQVEFVTHKRSSVKQTLSRAKHQSSTEGFMTKTEGASRRRPPRPKTWRKRWIRNSASDIASSIPTAATDAMKHLPKLIYGSNKVELDMFDGEDVPAQDADLSVSELTSSLRMIIKR